MMTREDVKTIVKCRSFWKIDRRKGNYKLPNGGTLHEYVVNLIESQLNLDGVGIDSNGEIRFANRDTGWNDEKHEPNPIILWKPFDGEDEEVSTDEHYRRVLRLASEIIG